MSQADKITDAIEAALPDGVDCVTFKSDGSAKAGVVKATPGKLFGMSFGNTNAAACYVRLYDLSAAPSATDTPVARFMIPGSTAGAGREKSWPGGLRFKAGIAYRITTGAADTDSTAAASNEVTGNFDYR